MTDSERGDEGGSGREPSPAAVREALERLLAKSGFVASDRLKGFLRFAVEETLAGRADRLKAYAVAVEVFGRDASFDPQTDPVVRMEAGKLRRRLESYYLGAGRDDPVRIDIPKGGYTPTFSVHQDAGEAAASRSEPSRVPRPWVMRAALLGLAGLGVCPSNGPAR